MDDRVVHLPVELGERLAEALDKPAELHRVIDGLETLDDALDFRVQRLDMLAMRVLQKL